jgi:hypothetical protein
VTDPIDTARELGRMAPRRRLGKKPPRVDRRTLKFSAYRTAAFPSLPPSVDWGSAVPPVPGWGMDGNDTLGCCTISGWAHADLLWTANANPPPWQPDVSTIEATYFALTGGPDTGLDLLTVLRYAQATGMGGHKIGPYVSLAVGNVEEAKQAIYAFGCAYIGVTLPDYIAQSAELNPPWVLPPQDSSFPPADPNDGHCVILTAYNDASQTFTGITWGQPVVVSYAFFEAYNDEGFGIISPDWLKPGGSSPPGLDLAALQADQSAITAEMPAPNPPIPALPWYLRLWNWLAALFHLA